MSDLSDKTTIVVGASRGLGRGIAAALAGAGAPVVAVARAAAGLADLAAGATPLPRPLQEQTWETFSVNWHTDVRIAFNWLRESLLKPLAQAAALS